MSFPDGVPVTDQRRAGAGWGGLPPEIVLRCWEDERFRHEFLASPRALLESAGVAVDAATEVRIVENTPSVIHFVLPDCPEGLRNLDPKALTPDRW